MTREMSEEDQALVGWAFEVAAAAIGDVPWEDLNYAVEGTRGPGEFLREYAKAWVDERAKK